MKLDLLDEYKLLCSIETREKLLLHPHNARITGQKPTRPLPAAVGRRRLGGCDVMGDRAKRPTCWSSSLLLLLLCVHMCAPRGQSTSGAD